MNKNSYISIGIVVLIVAATIWIKDGQAESRAVAVDVKNELASYKEIQRLTGELLTAKIDALANTVKMGAGESYTDKDHRIFVERMQELNPTLKIPKE